MIKQTRNVVLGIMALFSLMLMLRVVTLAPQALDSLAATCAYPFLLVQESLIKPIVRMTARRASLTEVTAALREYKEQNSTLLAENIACKAAQLHAKQMEEALRFAERYSTQDVLVGQVILRHFSQEAHFFLLDIGELRGVCCDMIAVYQNCLVGRVVEVYPRYCKVTLITDQTSKIPVVCTQTGTQGILEGLNKLDVANLSFVSHLQTMVKDDLILSSGDGLVYPKGFAAGRIVDFSLNANNGLIYLVTVKPLAPLRDIRFCCLLSKGTFYKDPLIPFEDVTPEIPVAPATPIATTPLPAKPADGAVIATPQVKPQQQVTGNKEVASAAAPSAPVKTVSAPVVIAQPAAAQPVVAPVAPASSQELVPAKAA